MRVLHRVVDERQSDESGRRRDQEAVSEDGDPSSVAPPIGESERESERDQKGDRSKGNVSV